MGAEDTLVSYREHIAARDELASKLHAIELQQARQAAALMHLPDKVDHLADAVNKLTQQIAARAEAPQVDQAILAIQHAAQAFTQPQQRNHSGGIERWLLLAMIGGAGWIAARFFMGT